MNTIDRRLTDRHRDTGEDECHLTGLLPRRCVSAGTRGHGLNFGSGARHVSAGRHEERHQPSLVCVAMETSRTDLREGFVNLGPTDRDQFQTTDWPVDRAASFCSPPLMLGKVSWKCGGSGPDPHAERGKPLFLHFLHLLLCAPDEGLLHFLLTPPPPPPPPLSAHAVGTRRDRWQRVSLALC